MRSSRQPVVSSFFGDNSSDRMNLGRFVDARALWEQRAMWYYHSTIISSYALRVKRRDEAILSQIRRLSIGGRLTNVHTRTKLGCRDHASQEGPSLGRVICGTTSDISRPPGS